MSKQKGQKSVKEGQTIELSQINLSINSLKYSNTENLEYEINYFVISAIILTGMNILIHKNNYQNYNFKLYFLTLIYLSRRVFYRLKNLYIYFNILSSLTSWIYTLIMSTISLNFFYYLFSLVMESTLYNFSTLFYPIILEITLFWTEKGRYTSPKREMFYLIKKILFLSFEMCYYCIFIPAQFSLKYNIYLNNYCLLLFSVIVFLNSFLLISSYLYYKKSAEFFFHAKLLGAWRKVPSIKIDSETKGKIKEWNKQMIPYKQNVLVKMKGEYYIGLELNNIEEPSDKLSFFFYFAFQNPRIFFLYFLNLQGMLSIIQVMLSLLMNSNALSVVLSLMCWYTFYFLHKISKRLKLIFNAK